MTAKSILIAVALAVLGWFGGRYTAPAYESPQVSVSPPPAVCPPLADAESKVPAEPTIVEKIVEKACPTKEIIKTVYLKDSKIVKTEVGEPRDPADVAKTLPDRARYREIDYMRYRPYRVYREYRAYKAGDDAAGGEKDCQTRPYDAKCTGTVAFCTREPNAPECKGTRAFCLRNKTDRTCWGTEVYCVAKPRDKSCVATTAACEDSPGRPECAGMIQSCTKFPLDDSCYGTEVGCARGTFDQDICTRDEP